MNEQQFKMTAMIYAPVPANSDRPEDVARFKAQVANEMWREVQQQGWVEKSPPPENLPPAQNSPDKIAAPVQSQPRQQQFGKRGR